MKWLMHGLAWVLLVLLILLAPMLSQRLPSTSEGMAAKTYERWAGVLRIWVSSGWQPGSGSLVPWLNKNLARFERQNPGVYVQVQPVSESLLVSFATGDINPPDVLIFAPGMLSSAQNLLELPVPSALLPGLRNVGELKGSSYATPIAMGGYAWAINTRLISGMPVGDIVLPAPPKKSDHLYLMQAPADSDHICWSGALLSLCLYAPRIEIVEPSPPPAGDGIDLGLEVKESEPSEDDSDEQLPQAELELSLPSELPKDFRKNTSAMDDFVAGRAAAIPVTQLELKRLEQLADNGRAPDYQILAGVRSFSDQLAMFAVVNYPRGDAAARQALCSSLLKLLLDDTSQQGLSSVRALRVTDGAALYSGQQAMAVLERSYALPAVSYPNVFDSGFRIRAQQRLDAELAG